MTGVLDIQKALAELGYDPGPLDGIRGRQTINAVKRFQAAMHLTVDGLVGAQTHKALFGTNIVTSPDATPWIDLAYRMKGLHESLNNAALRDFLKSDGGTVGDPSRVPWCGDFVQTCIGITLPEESLPSNPYAAINWLKFGKSCTARKGAVLVFWRGSPAGWEGHVGFYVGEDATHFHVLGGNQANSVNVSRIEKKRLRADGMRWPLTALEVAGGAIVKDGADIIETKNEA